MARVTERNSPSLFRIAFFVMAIIAMTTPLWMGCGGSDPAESLALRNAQVNQKGWRGDLFEFAVGNLNRLEQYDEQMLERVVGRLNEWISLVEPIAWTPDAMVEQLSDEQRRLPSIAGLEDDKFTAYDGHFLREAVWLRDVAASARIDPTLRASFPSRGQGDLRQDAENNMLASAMRLFDWTVRNIALEEPDSSVEGRPKFLSPWQVLLIGRGTAIERAWIFILLARQRGLDVVMLAYRDSDDADGWHDWAPALLVERQDETSETSSKMFVFEPELGIAMPGSDGRPVATLRELREDEQRLRQLDVDADHVYPVTTEKLEHLAAWIEASPGYLARRERQLESSLAGKRKMVLHVDATSLAKRLKKTGQFDAVGLWSVPYEALALRDDGAIRQSATALFPGNGAKQLPLKYRPWVASVRTGRVLHLKGRYTDTPGALQEYQRSRPSNKEIDASLTKGKILEAPTNTKQDGEDAPKNKRKWLTASEVEQVRRAKQDASYWLGVVAFERGDYDTAIDYFQLRTLEAWPEGPWTSAAQYNLARTLEALGRNDEAIELYENSNSPQQFGNRLRARWLRDKATETTPES